MQSLRSAVLSSPKLLTLVLCLLICSTLSYAAAPDRISGGIASAPTVRLTSGVPLQARAKFDQGAINPSTRLGYITLLTKPTNAQQKAINKLYADQLNPHSASYHKWLTPEQYADRFGLSQNDTKKITDWLQSHGFTIVKTARARNFVVFSGTAAQVDRTFQTQIHNFKVNGEIHFANTKAPVVPTALSGVISGFRGFNNFRAKSQAQRSHHNYEFPGIFTGHQIAPGDIAVMYDLNTLYTQGYDGSGQRLAVIGQTDVYLDDLQDFRTGFGLSSFNCTVNGTGVITSCNNSNFVYQLIAGDTDPGAPDSIGDDLPEADIDLEWSGGTAHNAQIIYVNAPDPTGNGIYDSMYDAIDNDYAPVMTMSYSFPCELAEAYYGTLVADEDEFTQANLEGITFMNSAGDTGAAECDYGDDTAVYGYAVAYPASSPEITGVGGTLIPYSEYTSTYWGTTNGTDGGSLLQYAQEAVWSDPQEWSIYCTATPADPICSNNPGLNDWQTAQEDIVGLWAGGGGVSNCVTFDDNSVCTGGLAQPAYQSGISLASIDPNSGGVLTTPTRYSPDVSLLASIYWPGYIMCTAESELGGDVDTSACAPGGAQGIINNQTNYGYVWGGTSISSPIFAGIVSMLNQYLNGSTNAGLGNINTLLYTLAATPSNNYFHPVTSGNNGAWCAPGTPSSGVPADPWPTNLVCPSSGPSTAFVGFDAANSDATTGYNAAVGLGSVDAANLFVAWATAVNPDFSLTDDSLNGGTTTVLAGVSGVGYSFTVAPVPPAATFGKAITFACSGLDATTSCIFNPASLAATDTTTDVTVTITTSGPNVSSGDVRRRQRADNRLPWLPFTLPIAGVVMVGLAGRKVSRYSAIVGLCLALVLLGLLLACGSSKPISVTAVTPNSVSLWPNNNADGWPSSAQAFTATVSNNTAVTWSLSPSGDSSGSIDSNGNYTAPTVAAGLPPTVTVTATSQQDSTKSNYATVTLKVATVPQTFNNVVVTVTSATNPPTQHSLAPYTLVVQ